MTPHLSQPTDAQPAEDVDALVAQHRDLLERVADADLPFSPRARAALARLEGDRDA
jgi:hypothetical protein